MPYFRDASDRPIIDPITLVVGNKKTVKLAGLPRAGDRCLMDHFSVRSSNAAALMIRPVGMADEKERDQVISLVARNPHDSVNIRADNAGSARDRNDAAFASVAPFRIRIVSPLMLPVGDSGAGLLARLLLAESLTPDHPAYGDGSDVIRAMRYMRIVAENRLAAAREDAGPLSAHSGEPASPDFRAVVVRPCDAQFDGFADYPDIALGKKVLVDRCVNNANNGTRTDFDLYRRHVEAAIAIAEGADLADADDMRPFFWRTASRPPPGPQAAFLFSLAGLDFYSLAE